MQVGREVLMALLTSPKKFIRDIVCEDELKRMGNAETMSQDEIEWQCKFQHFFKEEAIDYLKSCGCFSEKDWKKNFKALSLQQFHSECTAYSEIESLILQSKRMRILNMQLGDMTIPRIPPTIGGLSHLSSLYLYNIDTHFLPDELGELTSLKSLMIKNLPITVLPQAITKLGLLQLYVTGTLIHKFDLDFQGSKLATTMKELMIQNNKILIVDPSMKVLNLERIDVSGNIGLENIPNPQRPSSIVWINVSQTSIQRLSPVFFNENLSLIVWKNNLKPIQLDQDVFDKQNLAFKLEWFGSQIERSPKINPSIQFIPSL